MKPFFPRETSRLLIVALWLISELTFLSLNCHSADASKSSSLLGDRVSVHQIEPDQRGGKAYRLTYLVQVPIDVYWRFKTDFDNDFLLNNKYIREHQFISRTGDTVVTEDKYANAPDVFFKWQTTVHKDLHKLEFVLLNPGQCGQKFHYGFIQMESAAEGTLVTQVAYFDFWGASLWADYPWGGGMVDFLIYTARWEQGIILDLKDRYSGEPFKLRGGNGKIPALEYSSSLGCRARCSSDSGLYHSTPTDPVFPPWRKRCTGQLRGLFCLHGSTHFESSRVGPRSLQGGGLPLPAGESIPGVVSG
jgi:hypothetical protein